MNNWFVSLAAWMARLLPMPVKRAIYRFRPLAGWIRGSLNRSVPQGLTEVKVAAGGLAGIPMRLDLQGEKDYWLGTYEPDLQTAIQDWVQPGMVVYDVGANVGYVSLLLARQVGPQGQVFAFEALPSNLKRLHSNLELSELGARVRVAPGAVVEAKRPVSFKIGPSDDMGKAEGSAGRQDVTYWHSVDVQGFSLDEFVYAQGNPPPQLVKIDIEGGEVLALPGMRRLLAEARPRILLELHGPEAEKATWETLNAHGYHLYSMRPGYPPVDSAEALGWKAYIVALPPGDSK